MNKFRIEIVKSAKKELNKVPVRIQNKILEVLTFISHNPFSEFLNIKKIKGASSLFRIRIGDYRLVYEVQKEAFLIVVIKIGHRKDIYKR